MNKRQIVFTIILIFMLAVMGVGSVGASCGESFVVDEDGEVKATVDLRATVPNKKDDYEISLESRPREEVLPGGEIVYTIFYGCFGTLETEKMTLSVEWVLPEGQVAKYVPGSATTAYGDALPQVDKDAKNIIWEISNFPGSTTSKKVSFRLQASEEFREGGTFPIEVRARLALPGFVKETSRRVTVTYPEERVVEMLPQVPATVYRYAREFFAHPAFQTVFHRFLLILALFLPLFTLVVAALYLDFPPAFLPFLVPFLLRKFLVLIGVFDAPPVWGRVFSSAVGSPISLARVRVFDFSGRELGSTFTNRSGSFGFDLPEDHYLVEVRKPGFALETVRKNGIFLSESRFLYKFEPQEKKIVILALKRTKFLSPFWERFLEGFALEFSDFLAFFAFGVSLFYALLVGSTVSILLTSFFFIYLLTWTFVMFR